MALHLSPVQAEVTVAAEAGEVEGLDRVPQRITLLSRDQMEERATMTLAEAVDGDSGVNSLRTAPAMGAIFVRGLTGKNVSVYKDGVRFTTSAQRGGVSTFFNLIDISGLEAAEVLRGPNSAQYGSDSMGGALQLLSRPVTSGFHAEIAPFYQSAATAFGGNTLLSEGGERYGFVLNLAARRANTIRTGQGLDSHAAVTRFLGLPSTVFGERLPETGFTEYGGSLHGQVRLAPRQQLVGHYERSQQDAAKRYDQLLGGDGNLIADLRNLMLDFGYLRWQAFPTATFDSVSAAVSYNAQREERVNQGGQGNPLASVSHQYEKLRAWGMNFQATRRIGAHDVALGGEGYHESMTSPAFNFNPANGSTAASRPRVPDGARYLTYGLFAQDSWAAAPKLRLSGALRFGGASYKVAGSPMWPADSLAANALSGRVGTVYRPWQPVSFHAYYARGFRAPNMTDLGTLGLQGNGFFEASYAAIAGRNATLGDRADDTAQPTGVAVQPLRPETSDNFDVGSTVEAGPLRAEATAFWMSLGNTIVSQTLLLPPGATGSFLGDQPITRQLASGAVYVPLATNPVLVRANFAGARVRGVEQSLRLRLPMNVTFNQNFTWVYAEDERTGNPPDIEPGAPPLTVNGSLLWAPRARRVWVEPYATAADRQARLPSIAIADRRIAASRSRSNIASFFRNGATVRGLVRDGILLPTQETLAQVQNRVLGTANSAPMFNAIPGWFAFGVRAGWSIDERSDLFVDLFNLADRNYRGIGWGIDAPGRGATVRYRYRF